MSQQPVLHTNDTHTAPNSRLNASRAALVAAMTIGTPQRAPVEASTNADARALIEAYAQQAMDFAVQHTWQLLKPKVSCYVQANRGAVLSVACATGFICTWLALRSKR